MRTWAFIVYEESAPADWVNVLRNQGLQGFISPLHTPDDEAKKPHYHVMVRFEGHKSLKNLQEISGSVNGSKRVMPIQCWQGYARYLLHLDQPEKEQFADHSGVVSLGGLDYSEATRMTSVKGDSEQVFAIMDMIREQGFMDFYVAVRWLRDTGHKDLAEWLYATPTAASWIRETIKGTYHAWEREQMTKQNDAPYFLGSTTQKIGSLAIGKILPKEEREAPKIDHEVQARMARLNEEWQSQKG